MRAQRPELLAATVALACAVSPAAAAAGETAQPFAISSFTTGVSTTQAGAHPNVTTSLRLATHPAPDTGEPLPNEDPRDLTVNAPPGLVGNLTAVPACPEVEFQSAAGPGGFSCPPASQVGTATELYSDTAVVRVPVVMLEHGSGQVARLGVWGPQVVVIDVSLRTGRDYGITTTTRDIPQLAVWGVDLELWGVPAQHERGCQTSTYVELAAPGYSPELAAECLPATPPDPPAQWRAFLTNPTTCAGGSLTTTLALNSYQHPRRYITASSPQPPPTGCDTLAFDPSITLAPDTSEADAPSAYSLELTVPQDGDANGFASSELRDAVVTLPSGVTLDPSAANGLQACSDEQFGAGSTTPPSCPSASVIGSDEVTSPDVPEPLRGHLYVGQPEPGSMYRIFESLEGDGLDVKLEGTAFPDPASGQITAIFDDLPQLPFGELRLHLKGGSTAALANPPTCGPAPTTTDLTPWSGNADATPFASFDVTADGSGSACPAAWPFAPGFSAGSNSLVAGASTTFSLTLSRPDRTQYLGGLSVHLPPGLLGDLAGVPLCPSAQAAAGTCPPASAIGTVTASSGAGEAPLTLPGTVYLAQPRILNSPASLSVVVPAIAGPYNLGNVVVAADTRVNDDGSITVRSDPLPTILDGVPLRIRQIALDVTRPGFMRNPTSCAPRSVTATILSTHGQSVAARSPFQLADCQSLPFAPRFTVSTQARTSKANGASLDVKVSSAAGQANIAKVDVALPRQLPSRLTTLQQACSQAQFAADPAACPAGSVVGRASASTPLLNEPLAGPAILVSHAGAAFPDLVLVLQGQGATIELTGNTSIKNGVTYSRFDALPDVPVSAFELKLPEGPYSILAAHLPAKAHGSACGQRLTMPTSITGQNGAQVAQSTRIAVSGCPRAKRPSRRSSRAQRSRERRSRGSRVPAR
jgi:hypothetical protein